MRTLLTLRAGTTILHGTFDFDDRVASTIGDGRPTTTDLACRTSGTLLLPIDGKQGSLKAGAIARLPMLILSGWPKEIYLVVLPTPDQFPPIHVPCIYDMLLGQELMNR